MSTNVCLVVYKCRSQISLVIRLILQERKVYRNWTGLMRSPIQSLPISVTCTSTQSPSSTATYATNNDKHHLQFLSTRALAELNNETLDMNTTVFTVPNNTSLKSTSSKLQTETEMGKQRADTYFSNPAQLTFVLRQIAGTTQRTFYHRLSSVPTMQLHKLYQHTADTGVPACNKQTFNI